MRGVLKKVSYVSMQQASNLDISCCGRLSLSNVVELITVWKTGYSIIVSETESTESSIRGLFLKQQGLLPA